MKTRQRQATFGEAYRTKPRPLPRDRAWRKAAGAYGFASPSPYFDRVGRKIGLRRWAVLQSKGPRYRVVQRTTVEGVLVSTVWLGLDHSLGLFGEGRQIFETMTFTDAEMGHDEEWGSTRRYATEREARRGHREVVEEVREQLDGRAIMAMVAAARRAIFDDEEAR